MNSQMQVAVQVASKHPPHPCSLETASFRSKLLTKVVFVLHSFCVLLAHLGVELGGEAGVDVHGRGGHCGRCRPRAAPPLQRLYCLQVHVTEPGSAAGPRHEALAAGSKPMSPGGCALLYLVRWHSNHSLLSRKSGKARCRNTAGRSKTLATCKRFKLSQKAAQLRKTHPDADVKDQRVEERHVVVGAREGGVAWRQQQPAAQSAQPQGGPPVRQVAVHLRPAI